MKPRLSEATWQSQVRGLARTLGYELQYHTWTSIHSASGFPDLVLVRPADHPKGFRLVFIECKAESRQPTAEQWWWLAELQQGGYEAWLVRPSDWEELARILQEEVRK